MIININHTSTITSDGLSRPAAHRCASFTPVLVAVGPEPLPEPVGKVAKPDESAAPNLVTDANGIVLAPITISELSSDMAVPESVMALLP